jgi:hypothetical protein
MLVTVGQPLRKARTTTTGPCRAHTVFGPTCVSIMARAMRAGSTAQSPATSQRDGLPSAADPRDPPMSGTRSTSSSWPRTLVAAQDPAANSAFLSDASTCPGAHRDPVPGHSDIAQRLDACRDRGAGAAPRAAAAAAVRRAAAARRWPTRFASRQAVAAARLLTRSVPGPCAETSGLPAAQAQLQANACEV